MNRRRIWLVGASSSIFVAILLWLILPGRHGNLHYARANHGAVLLPGGQVLVIGGNYDSSPLLDPDGAWGEWLQKNGASWLRFLTEPSSIQPLSSCELFDPKTQAWTEVGSLHWARAPSLPLLLPDGTVLESGGDTNVPRAEVYKDGSWTETEPFVTEVDDTVLLPDGGVLGTPSEFVACSIYQNRMWKKMDDAKVQGGLHVVLGNGLVLAAGEEAPTGECGCSLYDPARQKWKTTAEMLQPRDDFCLVTLADGRALAIGGESDSDTLKECEIFDPKTETWKRTGDLTTERMGSIAVRLHDGQVLIIGADDEKTNSSDPSCELYNPATSHWSKTGSLVEGREGFTATVLQDGQVLVTGGLHLQTYLSSCELYDPKTGTWSRL